MIEWQRIRTWKFIRKVGRILPLAGYRIIFKICARNACSLLDAGCGAGNITIMERFKSEALYLCGVDIDDYALFRARSLNIYDGLIRCDVRFLPFRSDAFDIVLCREVIEHLEKVEAFMACPPKIGPPWMRDSCKIRTGGSISESKKVLGGTGIPDPQGS